MFLTKRLRQVRPDKTSKAVLTKRLPDKTSKAVLTKCLPDKTSADHDDDIGDDDIGDDDYGDDAGADDDDDDDDQAIEDLVQPWSCRQANDMAAARHT